MATERASMRLRRWLAEPEAGGGLWAFRTLFGAVMLVSTVRFVAMGWVDEFYVQPSFHFAWPGLGWLSPWPEPLLYAHFALVALAAAGIMVGYRPRLSAAVFFVGFTTIELFDRTYYLNHYYLVSLVALLLMFMPAPAGARAGTTAPRWARLVLRAQLTIVYVYAGIAKLDPDWLLRGEPLATWLKHHGDLVFVGSWLTAPTTALSASWAGALFDLGVAPLLWWRRSRGVAYAAVVTFHVATGLLLPIGIFPLLMIALTTSFLAPDWPSRLGARLGARIHGALSPFEPSPSSSGGSTVGRAPTLLLAGYLAVQVLLPARHILYPGDVDWTEEGFRFAWRVMLVEKTGHVELRALDPDTGARWLLHPRDELTERQRRIMSTQPDMIRQYARHVGRDLASRGHPRVQVFVDAWASLNGRPACRLFLPDVDIMAPGADGLARACHDVRSSNPPAVALTPAN